MARAVQLAARPRGAQWLLGSASGGSARCSHTDYCYYHDCYYYDYYDYYHDYDYYDYYDYDYDYYDYD